MIWQEMSDIYTKEESIWCLTKRHLEDEFFCTKWNIKCVKPEKNSIFLKNGKMVISVKNRKFSRSRMTKRTAPLNSSREI